MSNTCDLNTGVVQPTTVLDNYHQLYYLERVYGYSPALPLIETSSNCPEQPPFNAQLTEDSSFSDRTGDFDGYPSISPWNTYETGAAIQMDPSFRMPGASSSTESFADYYKESNALPRTPNILLVRSPPHLLYEDSTLSSSFSSSPLHNAPTDHIIPQRLLAQVYTDFARDNSHLSNAQLLNQTYPCPRLLTMNPAFPVPSALASPSPISCNVLLPPESTTSALPPSPFQPPGYNYHSASPALLTHLPPPTTVRTYETMAFVSNPSPSLLSSTPPSLTQSSFPCLPQPVLARSLATTPDMQLSSPRHPYLHIGSDGEDSSSHPDSRASTPATSRAIDDSAFTFPSSDVHLDSPLGREIATRGSDSNSSDNKRGRRVTPYRCPVCLKSYANNSTLRRHLKIHAYACSAAVTAAAAAAATSSPPLEFALTPTLKDKCLPTQSYPLQQQQSLPLLESNSSQLTLRMPVIDPQIADAAATDAINTGSLLNEGFYYLTPTAVAAVSTSPSPILANVPAFPPTSSPCPSSSPSSSSSSSSSFTLSIPALATTSALLSSSILQYRPGVDTDSYRKPECVGCNKAFARRDTVILHIKNIRRKWEIHWHQQLLATAALAIASREQGGGEEDSMTMGHHNISNHVHAICSGSGDGTFSNGNHFGYNCKQEDIEQRTTEKNDATTGGTHHPKFSKEEEERLLRALTDISPCWRERKVRMFGSFGMVEEPVVQD